jgi:hypothetical protein
MILLAAAPIINGVALLRLSHPSSQRQVRCRGSAQAVGAEWWKAHSELFTDVADADGLQSLLTSCPDRLTVIEWLSPTCQHCSAAQETLASVAGQLGTRGDVSFARVACSSAATKALAMSAGVKAFPLVVRPSAATAAATLTRACVLQSLHRGGSKLLELTPSSRGGEEAAARRLQQQLAVVADDKRGPAEVHFTLLAGVVSAQDGPAPLAPTRFDYAAMRAAAAAQLALEALQDAADEEECGATEDDEECAPHWT